jgi:hypothetical protein
MSAAWGTAESLESVPRLQRIWRMWSYVSVGSIFYMLVRFYN